MSSSCCGVCEGGEVFEKERVRSRSIQVKESRSILTSVKRVREGRSLTVKQFQKLLGLMSAASNVIPFGLLYMRPLQWWLKTNVFSLRGNPLCMIKVMRRCLCVLDMWRKPLFFCLRAWFWELLVAASRGCISHRLGSGHE